MGGLLLGRLRGVDIRRLGCGNAGATNAMRTQGKAFGIAVLLIDIAKGVFAVRWLPGAVLPGIGLDPAVSREWLAVGCGCAAIVGHVYPVWYGFRGGKGVATVLGVAGAVQPWLLVPLLASWLAVVLLSGFVGLASMCAGAAMLAAVLVRAPDDRPLLTFAAAVAALRHLHPPQQYRAHAGRAGKPRAAPMAVPVAGGIGRPALLELLADGQLHSGESLAAALGLTRAAVWKGVERLRALGHRGAGAGAPRLSPGCAGGTARAGRGCWPSCLRRRAREPAPASSCCSRSTPPIRGCSRRRRRRRDRPTCA